jgi:competence protein ComEA
MSKNRYWALGIILLIIAIVTGGVIVWARYHQPEPIEISLPPSPQFQGEVYIGGAVSNPGFYPVKADDSLEALIGAAGGATDNANLTQLKLYIPAVGEEQQPQRININRAEVWLLEALPEIGETLAQRIIDYRQQNGGFGNTTEITRVEGIGPDTYEKIKNLITVAD